MIAHRNLCVHQAMVDEIVVDERARTGNDIAEIVSYDKILVVLLKSLT